MSVTVQLDLPDSLLKEAQASGILQPEYLSNLLSMELRRRKAACELGRVLNTLREQPGPTMNEDEVAAEVNATRAEKRKREAGR